MNSDFASSILRRSKAFLFFFLTALIIAVTSPSSAGSQEPSTHGAKAVSESAKPIVGISFSQQTIGERDAVYVQTWFSNETGSNLTEIKLEVLDPGSLEWHDKDCSGPVISNPFSLEIPARYAFVEHRFCLNLKRGSEIQIGDCNVLFIFQYQWKDGNTLKRSILSVEKPLKIVLLGSDNIVGIPLGLAGLIFPGLFFWFAVSLWKVPWGVGLALGENLFYSLVVSAIFVAVGVWISHLEWLPHKSWLLTMDVLNGVSLTKLGQLAVTGMVVGTAVGGVDKAYRLYRRKRQQALTINPDDPVEVLLEKLLNQHANTRNPLAIVRLKDNTEYHGSLGAQTANATILIGWFKVDLKKFPGKSSRHARDYMKANRLIDLLELAHSKGVAIELYDAVRDATNDKTTGEPSMHWKNDDVVEFRIEPGKGTREPLVLA